MMTRSGVLVALTMLLLMLLPWQIARGQAYEVSSRSIQSSSLTRTFILARPNPIAANLPLVFSLHGDGGNGSAMRLALPLEAQANFGAVFVYPNAPGGTFEYFSDSGRAREVQFVRDAIDAMAVEFGIDRARVFITGFSGGATMANALGCRMEADEVRGLGIHSGSLYPVGNDFSYTANGGVSCALPASVLVWGMNDSTAGVDFATGQAVRDNHRATQRCATSSTPRMPAPCVSYDGCGRPVAWCAIPALGHSIWNQAAAAIWGFFAQQTPPQSNSVTIYDDALRNGFQNFSWGVVDFADASAPRSGTLAIRFNAHSFQGLSFARPAMPVAVASYPDLRFWIRGAVGGEQLNISLQSGNVLHANVPLAPFIVDGAIAAGAYREVRVRFAQPPMNYSGTFERINVQDASGNAPAAPQVVYVDDVELLVAAASESLFGDGFE